MAEISEMNVDEIIAELEKLPGESKFDSEELSAHLTVLSWFRNNTGRKARAYLSPGSTTPFVLTKEKFVQLLKGQIGREQ